MTGQLHALTNEEAEVLALRASAIQRFSDRYRHNGESQRAMVGSLRRLATEFTEGICNERTFPWELVVDADLSEQLWSTVAERYSVKTAEKDASALRQMLDCCRRVGLLTYEEYRNATSFTAKNAGRPTQPVGQYLAPSDVGAIVQSLLNGTGHQHTRIRDAALLLAMASSGARGWEISGAQLHHTHLDEARIWLERTKGGRPRNAWLHPLAVEILRLWLGIRGPQPGALFRPLSRTGRPLHDHGELSTQQIRKIVHARTQEAGYDGVAPHDLRRFLISSLLETNDLALVARVVGHKNPATTAGYDRRPLKPSGTLSPPWSCPRWTSCSRAQRWGQPAGRSEPSSRRAPPDLRAPYPLRLRMARRRRGALLLFGAMTLYTQNRTGMPECSGLSFGTPTTVTVEALLGLRLGSRSEQVDRHEDRDTYQTAHHRLAARCCRVRRPAASGHPGPPCPTWNGTVE